MFVLAVALWAYTVTGGADYGVGILESLSPRHERPRLRTLAEKAIAPIWEANHIWIILALVIVFVAYPKVHVSITTRLQVPLLLMLAGIVLRGTAFTFRYYDRDDDPAVV
jgi:cytochrome d ubiquinol oxidase subunit II